MLPGATLPAARYFVTPARRRVCVRGLPGPRREARRRKEPARDAAAGLAEVLAMPAIWKDAAGDLLELPGPGGGIVVCGALPGAAAPVPAWTAGELAAAGVAAEPGPVRDGTGLGLVSCVTGPALIGEALAGTPARRARKLTPRLMMELSLARALEPGTAPATLRALAQRPREADPGYDLPAASSLSDAEAFLQVKSFLRLLALLSGEVRPVPLPGVTPVLPAPGTPDGDQTRPVNVGAGGGAGTHPRDHDPPQGMIGLPVAAAVSRCRRTFPEGRSRSGPGAGRWPGCAGGGRCAWRPSAPGSPRPRRRGPWVPRPPGRTGRPWPR